jgi:hypothetical protein
MVGAAIICASRRYLAIPAPARTRLRAPIFLAAWGVLVVSTIDNIARPWAMKGRASAGHPAAVRRARRPEAFASSVWSFRPLVPLPGHDIVDIYKESFRTCRAATPATRHDHGGEG